MGFDLTGIINKTIPLPDWALEADHPSIQEYFKIQRETKGAYFRVTSWGWRPIPAILKQLKLITKKDHDGAWFYNDNILIKESKSQEIGKGLILWLDSRIKDLELSPEDLENYILTIDGRIMGEIEFTEVWTKLPQNTIGCKYCGGTGIRTDMIVIDGCNVCKGLGKTSTSNMSYYINLSRLREFAEFALASGGFRIA
jgi:hypothetical protein